MIDLKTLNKFRKHGFRQAYIAGRVRTSIAMQIRLLREKLRLTQTELANKMGKKQTAISRMENLAYGRVTVNTLLEISEALDLALVVRFVSFDEFFRHHGSVTPNHLIAETFSETLARREMVERQITHSQALIEHAMHASKSTEVSDHQALIANLGQTGLTKTRQWLGQ